LDVPADRTASLASRFTSQLSQGIASAYEVLVERLGDPVEMRHLPAVPTLDGWRDRGETACYLRTEASQISRAFAPDLIVSCPHVIVNTDSIVLDPLTWHGTVRHPRARQVSVAYRVVISLTEGRISRIEGHRHWSTSKHDLRLWLEAVELTGGFHPPKARPGAAAGSVAPDWRSLRVLNACRHMCAGGGPKRTIAQLLTRRASDI
jgi:hypothetical protein